MGFYESVWFFHVSKILTNGLFFVFPGKWKLALPRSTVASPDHLQPLQLSTDDAAEGLHDDAVLLDATSTLQERCIRQIKNHACNYSDVLG